MKINKGCWDREVRGRATYLEYIDMKGLSEEAVVKLKLKG